METGREEIEEVKEGRHAKAQRGVKTAATAMSEEMSRCIEICLSCYKTCLSTAMNHCLETGGKHVEPAHFRLMMACAEICGPRRISCLINTPRHKHTCKECRANLRGVRQRCERIGGIEECVAMCRACVNSCRKMAA